MCDIFMIQRMREKKKPQHRIIKYPHCDSTHRLHTKTIF